jgi:hypothetical protein
MRLFFDLDGILSGRGEVISLEFLGEFPALLN